MENTQADFNKFGDFNTFFEDLCKLTAEESYQQVVIADDIKFSKTKWSQMSSSVDYKNDILQIFKNLNLSNAAST